VSLAGSPGAGGSGQGGGGAGAGAAPAAAGAVAPAPVSPASPNRAITVLIATVSPSFARISVSTPAAGAGISASTLSVEISSNGSSRCTVSPTFFNHLTILPSAMDSAIWRIKTSVAIHLLLFNAFRIRAVLIRAVYQQPPVGWLNARRHPMNRFSRFHHSLRQRRVSMHYKPKLFRRGLQPHRHAGFGQQVGGVRADDVDAEHLVVFGVSDDFDEAFSFAQDHRLAQGREREFADLDLIASLFSFRFAQTDAADFRFAVSAIGHAVVIDRLRIAPRD